MSIGPELSPTPEYFPSLVEAYIARRDAQREEATTDQIDKFEESLQHPPVPKLRLKELLSSAVTSVKRLVHFPS